VAVDSTVVACSGHHMLRGLDRMPSVKPSTFAPAVRTALSVVPKVNRPARHVLAPPSSTRSPIQLLVLVVGRLGVALLLGTVTGDGLVGHWDRGGRGVDEQISLASASLPARGGSAWVPQSRELCRPNWCRCAEA
jgi:hypothetical protein